MPEPNPEGGGDDPPERPEHVPEKFWNAETGAVDVEALAKSYTALEQRLSPPPKPEPAPGKSGLEIEPTEPGDLPEDATIEQILQHAGLDPTQIGQHFAKHGELKPSDYAKLRKAGFPKGAVNQFLATSLTLSRQTTEAARRKAIETAGSEEALQNLLAWGKTGLSEADLMAYNQLQARPETVGTAVELLMAKHKAAVGAGEATPLLGGTGGGGGPDGPFTTRHAAVAAINDPRYDPSSDKYDEAFANSVDRRLKATEDLNALPA